MFDTQINSPGLTDLATNALFSSSSLLRPDPLDTSLTNSAAFTSRASQVAFVDAALPDYQTLVAGIKSGTDVYLLNSTGNELNQISQVLAGYSNLSAISLFSHGSNGALQLGNSSLNSDSLTNYAGVLQSWASSLSAEGDLLLYGCEVADDVTGQSFVQQIATLTGADVAASTDLTGSSTQGGDWDLEFSTGSIEASPVLSDWAQADYENVLATFTVNTLADTVDANDGFLSLREAIDRADATAGEDAIAFSVTGTITLNSQLVLDDNAGTTISGDNAITVSGNNAVRVFEINSEATATLDGLTISGGKAPEMTSRGGGIFNQGTLTVSNSTLSDNSAGVGGGIDNDGNLTVNNSTFSGNSANSGGGGIANVGNLTVNNSTFSGNSTSFDGGGINSVGLDNTLTVNNSTFSRNSSGRNGGGIYANIVSVNVSNSIVAGNTAATSGREINFNAVRFSSGGYNLFGFNGDSGLRGVTTTSTDITPNVDLSAILDTTLRDNGGPTLTLALVNGSPAINAGNTNLTTDQRGIARPQGVADDIGAFEFKIVNRPPDAKDDTVTANQSSEKIIPVSVLLANDTDPDGNALRVVSVGNATNGTVSLNDDGSPTDYSDDYVVFTPNSNFSGTASFTYTIDDGNGEQDSALVNVIVGITRNGGNGKDTFNGTNGDDIFDGGNGQDILNGGKGNDKLFGGNGPDRLNGGEGNDYLNGGKGPDTLTGGTGSDTFVLRLGEGGDLITDFTRAQNDKLGLANGLTINQLSFSGNSIFYGSELLATLDGVDTTTLEESDFITV